TGDRIILMAVHQLNLSQAFKIKYRNLPMNKFTRYLLIIIILFSLPFKILAKDGYELWQQYQLVENQQALNTYRSAISEIVFHGNSATIEIPKKELAMGLNGLL